MLGVKKTQQFVKVVFIVQVKISRRKEVEKEGQQRNQLGSKLIENKSYLFIVMDHRL